MSDSSGQLPNGWIVFGPDANCTLELCPVEWSVYKYRPSLASSIVFIILYALAMATHIYLGIRWKTKFFMIMMIIGCLIEIIGYGGRIMLYNNPFDFIGFILQICLITCGPVFYTAAIYVTLAKTITHFAPEISRFKPNLVWYIFIPADVICLVLQAAGGAMSSISSGSSQKGIDIAMAGLALQVAVLFFFCVVFGDYMFRYFRLRSDATLSRRMRFYFGFLATAVVLILGRCCYRCYELSEGYQDSKLITDEGLFIGLEGVLIVLAVYSLCIGHPGLVFNEKAGLGPGNQTHDVERQNGVEK